MENENNITLPTVPDMRQISVTTSNCNQLTHFSENYVSSLLCCVNKNNINKEQENNTDS